MTKSRSTKNNDDDDVKKDNFVIWGIDENYLSSLE